MVDPVEALILDLLEWLAAKPRPYAEVMEAWRTSCPRLPVWEEANVSGFVAQEHREGIGSVVCPSPSGLRWLAQHRASAATHVKR
jgi:D-3-phosphoglycerate dehydrogenase